MGETIEDASEAPKPKPTILVPQRDFLFASGSGPGFSPGPMTLVSNLFPEHSPFSFSQLLAGAMASPLAAKQGVSPANDLGKEGGFGSGVGLKRNRPTNLAVAPPQAQLDSLSSLFAVPPGHSPGLPNSPGFLSPLQSPFGMSHQQALAHVTAQAALSQSFKQMQSDFHNSISTDAAEGFANPSALTQQTNPPPKPENSKIESSEVSQSDGKSSNASGDKSADDGYNWRKYGQKNVKASECPRSYYKCTHLNCPVKKKVERSLDGHISEITYKGQHNHELPQLQKRGKDNSADKTANSRVNPVSTSLGQTESNELNEATIVHSESANSHHQVAGQNDDLRNSPTLVHKGDAPEPFAKRRSTDSGPPIPASSLQTISETKIVLQTRSEVDLLDDGYKWRKYGQKVVKGNPYPRSYYRCTFAGCNVRKHVERASADPKAVITTYEGKHNHDIPTGRHTGHSTGNTSYQQSKTQKPILNESKTDYAGSDKMPTDLQLKEEHGAS